MSERRSRLSRAIAAEQRVTALRAEVTAQLARFSADPAAATGGWAPPGANGASYHAAQTTRLRQFSEGLYGFSPQHEEKMLRPYDRARIISRCRLMIRNNPWVAAIFLAYAQEMGAPTYKSTAELGGPEASKEYNDQREHLMSQWASDCESGDDLSLEEVVEIWWYERIIAGEMFVVKLYDGTLQLIPSELCGSALQVVGKGAPLPAGTTFADGTPVPSGTLEKDGILRLNGIRVGYRFARRDDNGNVDFSAAGGKTTLVRAAYVIHLYDRDRIEQDKGVPFCVTLLGKMQDLFETGDARSQQVKNAACLSMWITKNMDPYGFAEAMKGSLRQGTGATGVADAVALKEIASQRTNFQELKAGAVYYGATNEDLRLIEPKLNSNDWRDHYIDLVQICCAPMDGMPVEVALEGFRNSSYSSSRATMNKWKRNVVRRRRRAAQKLLDPLQLWQTRRFELFKELEPIPEDQRHECRWGWPQIPDIDGLKTSMQNAADLAIGATNLRAIYADKGEHYDVEMKQFAREKAEFLKELIAAGISAGLKPDEARTWALTQVPSGDGRALAALITATGALGAEAPPPAPAKK